MIHDQHMIPILWDSHLPCLCAFFWRITATTSDQWRRAAAHRGHQQGQAASMDTRQYHNYCIPQTRWWWGSRAWGHWTQYQNREFSWLSEGFDRDFYRIKSVTTDNSQVKLAQAAQCVLIASCLTHVLANIGLHVEHTCEISQQRCQGWDMIEKSF